MITQITPRMLVTHLMGAFDTQLHKLYHAKPSLASLIAYSMVQGTILAHVKGQPGSWNTKI